MEITKCMFERPDKILHWVRPSFIQPGRGLLVVVKEGGWHQYGQPCCPRPCDDKMWPTRCADAYPTYPYALRGNKPPRCSEGFQMLSPHSPQCRIDDKQHPTYPVKPRAYLPSYLATYVPSVHLLPAYPVSTSTHCTLCRCAHSLTQFCCLIGKPWCAYAYAYAYARTCMRARPHATHSRRHRWTSP